MEHDPTVPAGSTTNAHPTNSKSSERETDGENKPSDNQSKRSDASFVLRETGDKKQDGEAAGSQVSDTSLTETEAKQLFSLATELYTLQRAYAKELRQTGIKDPKKEEELERKKRELDERMNRAPSSAFGKLVQSLFTAPPVEQIRQQTQEEEQRIEQASKKAEENTPYPPGSLEEQKYFNWLSQGATPEQAKRAIERNYKTIAGGDFRREESLRRMMTEHPKGSEEYEAAKKEQDTINMVKDRLKKDEDALTYLETIPPDREDYPPESIVYLRRDIEDMNAILNSPFTPEAPTLVKLQDDNNFARPPQDPSAVSYEEQLKAFRREQDNNIRIREEERLRIIENPDPTTATHVTRLEEGTVEDTKRLANAQSQDQAIVLRSMAGLLPTGEPIATTPPEPPPTEPTPTAGPSEPTRPAEPAGPDRGGLTPEQKEEAFDSESGDLNEERWLRIEGQRVDETPRQARERLMNARAEYLARLLTRYNRSKAGLTPEEDSAQREQIRNTFRLLVGEASRGRYDQGQAEERLRQVLNENTQEGFTIAENIFEDLRGEAERNAQAAAAGPAEPHPGPEPAPPPGGVPPERPPAPPGPEGAEPPPPRGPDAGGPGRGAEGAEEREENPLIFVNRQLAIESFTPIFMQMYPELTREQARRRAEIAIRDMENLARGEGVVINQGTQAEVNLVRLFAFLQQAKGGRGEEGLSMDAYDPVLAAKRGATMFERFYYTWSGAYSRAKPRILETLKADWIRRNPGSEVTRDIERALEASAGTIAKERGNKAARELVEELLLSIEIDDQSLRQEDIMGLTQAVNSVFADDQDFRAELAETVNSRTQIHIASFAAKYLGAEQFSGVPMNMLEFHWSSLFNTTGVRKAVKILESKDKYGVKGEYYRSPEQQLLVRDLVDDPENKKQDQLIDRLSLLTPEQFENEPLPNNLSDGFTSADFKLLYIIAVQARQDMMAKVPAGQDPSNYERSGFHSKVKAKIWEMKHKYKLIELQFGIQPEGVADTRPIPERERLEYVDFFRDQDPNLDRSNEELIKIALFVLGERNKIRNRKYVPDSAVRELIDNQQKYLNVIQHLNNIDTQRGDPDELDSQAAFTRLLAQLDRAFAVGERIHHTTLMSTQFDGPRWKEGTSIPERFWTEQMRRSRGTANDLTIAQKGQAVVFNRWIKVEDPDTKEVMNINLRTIEEDAEDHTNPVRAGKYRRALQNLTKINHETRFIAEQWHEEIGDFYINYFDHLDHDAAGNTKSPRQLGRVTYEADTLFKKSEARKPKAEYLARYMYLGLMSASQFLGFSSAEKTTVDGWDEYYQNLKFGWVRRYAAVDKLRELFTTGEIDLLNSAGSMLKPWEAQRQAKVLAKSMFTIKELDRFDDVLSKGIYIQNTTKEYSEQLGLESLNLAEGDNLLTMQRLNGVLSKKKEKEIKKEVAGNLLFYNLIYLRQNLSFTKGLWAMLMRFLKEIAPSEKSI